MRLLVGKYLHDDKLGQISHKTLSDSLSITLHAREGNPNQYIASGGIQSLSFMILPLCYVALHFKEHTHTHIPYRRTHTYTYLKAKCKKCDLYFFIKTLI